jgi:simple sugar transport system permease protein
MDAVISFLNAAIVAGTPILFATLGEIITERSGNLNLGVEGMMLMGAVMGFMVGFATGSATLALLTAMIAGACGAFIFAFLTITLRANQTVTGLTLTIFGSGFADFVGQDLIGQIAPEGLRLFFRPYNIPVLGNIPFIGPIFFKQDAFVYLGYITAVLLGIYLYKTSWGMNLRAVGENPGAADAQA